MKRIFLCIDGTSNGSEIAPGKPTPSNVLLFARALEPVGRDGLVQVVGYMRGVGTDTSAGILRRTFAQATGGGFSLLIQEAYEFLANNYQAGDEVYLLGFSRGAAAARSLSGFTELFGVIPKRFMALFPVAWEYYNTPPQARHSADLRTKSPELWNIADEGGDFRLRHVEESQRDMQEPRDARHGPRAHSFVEGLGDRVQGEGRPVYVPLYLHFVGVWDTVFHVVDSEGFHESRLAWNVGTARHALAIHEVRRDFVPALWDAKCAHQDVKQVWFTGAHSDVGGGNGNVELSSVPLEWMAQQVYAESGKKLGFDYAFSHSQGLPDPRAEVSYPQDDWIWRAKRPRERPIGGPFQFQHWTQPWRRAGLPPYLWRSRKALQTADAAAANLPLE